MCVVLNKNFLLSLIWNTWPLTSNFKYVILLMTAMKAISILPALCHLHLSRQHIMNTSLIFTDSLSHLTFRGNSKQGDMCSSFSPCYFAIVHIKYHMKNIRIQCGAIQFLRWRHMHSTECCLYAAYIVMYILHLIVTLPKITFLPIQKGSVCVGCGWPTGTLTPTDS